MPNETSYIMKKNKIVTFGEIMLRLSKPAHCRLFQGSTFKENYGGSEANVSVSLATLGDDVEYITRVPDNLIGTNVCLKLNEYNVSTAHVVRGGDRLGTYFFEGAAAMRNSCVVYDRQDSAFYSLRPEMIDWHQTLQGAGILHTSGISCAVSQGALDTVMAAISAAEDEGLTISFDINYRKNLWKYGRKAEDVLPEACRHADIIFGDQGEYEILSGMKRVPFTASDSNYSMDLDAFKAYFEAVQALYPKCKKFVMACRNQITSNHHTLSGLIFTNGKLYSTRIYDITEVVDPMGVGDAFIAAYLHSYMKWGDDNQHCLDFSLAASAVKNSIVGDFNLVDEEEINRIMNDDDEDFKIYAELD